MILRTLILEDNRFDVELLVDALRQAGFEAEARHAGDREGFIAGLSPDLDIILADFRVPRFGAFEALKHLADQGIDVPLIIVTGTLGEENAAECIKRGAADLVVKDRLTRLGSAIRQALATRQLKMQRDSVAADLRETRRRYQLVFENAAAGIMLTTMNGGMLTVNAAGAAMLGYVSPEEMIASVPDISTGLYADPEERDSVRQLLAQQGEVRDFAIRYKRKDGSMIPVSLTTRVLDEEHDGRRMAISIVRDMSNRFEVDAALRKSEALLEAAQAQAHFGSWTFERGTETWLWSKEMFRLFGRDSKSETPTFAEFLEMIHPEDRTQLLEIHQRAIDTGEPAKLDFRSSPARGPIRFYASTIHVVNDAQGRFLNLAGTVLDITDRKQQEQKIARLSRIHAVLSGINSAIVRLRDRQALFDEACRIAVEQGGFRMAWIGLTDAQSREVKPVAWAGVVGGFLDNIQVSVIPGTAEAGGVGGTAIITGKTAVDNNISENMAIERDRREKSLQRGYRSAIGLPLMEDTNPVGAFIMYAGQPDFFDDEEIKLLEELAADVSFAMEFLRKAGRLEYLAYYDALTGLANRTSFLDRATQQLIARHDSHDLVALMLLDVERFRVINNTLSRQGGDSLLRQIAHRLDSNISNAHYSNPARVGADCFGLIIHGSHDINELAHYVDDGIRNCFDEAFMVDGQEVRIAAKAGIAVFPGDGSNAETLFRNAEAALRNAKKAAQRIVFYAPDMTAQVAEHLALETKLRKALELGQFILHYQPKIELANGRICGLEALIRWQNPEAGLVPPGMFIPLLEETGLIVEVGNWALEQALSDYRRWIERGFSVPRIAVNVSAVQLQQRDYVDTVTRMVKQAGDLAEAIELEITESLIMQEVKAGIHKLTTLRKLGIHIAMDDFGTGYSSLSYMARLPINSIKIDRSFINGMTENAHDRNIVSTIIALARSLTLRVIAEGVETEGQRALLVEMGCDEAQGYLLSKPLPAAELEAKILSRANSAGVNQLPFPDPSGGVSFKR